jgi:hypothetical protein
MEVIRGSRYAAVESPREQPYWNRPVIVSSLIILDLLLFEGQADQISLVIFIPIGFGGAC